MNLPTEYARPLLERWRLYFISDCSIVLSVGLVLFDMKILLMFSLIFSLMFWKRWTERGCRYIPVKIRSNNIWSFHRFSRIWYREKMMSWWIFVKRMKTFIRVKKIWCKPFHQNTITTFRFLKIWFDSETFKISFHFVVMMVKFLLNGSKLFKNKKQQK